MNIILLGKEQRLTVFEDRIQRTIFGPKQDKVSGNWRKLHNEELLTEPVHFTKY
jgi:hypothetical protein